MTDEATALLLAATTPGARLELTFVVPHLRMVCCLRY
jgi:hypothetical protein